MGKWCAAQPAPLMGKQRDDLNCAYLYMSEHAKPGEHAQAHALIN